MAIQFKLRESYDWAVIGETPGALLSAALAARMGFSTIIVPTAARASLFRSSSGQVVDPESGMIMGGKIKNDPQSGLPLSASSENYQGLLGRCLQKLELIGTEVARLEWLPFSFRVETPSGRFAYGGSDRFLTQELNREFGDNDFIKKLLNGALSNEKSGRKYWESFIDFLTWRDDEFSRKKQPKILNRALGATKLQSANTASLLPSEEKDPVEKRCIEEILQGIGCAVQPGFDIHHRFASMENSLYLASEMFRAKGGLENFRSLLIDIAKRWGAHVLSQNECKRVFIESGKFVGFQASQVASMISARAGAIEVPPWKLASILELSGKSKAPEKTKTKAAGWVFTLSFTIQKSHLPTSLGHRWVWSEAGSPVIDFEIAEPIEYEITEPDHRYLFVRTLMPWTNESLDPKYLRKLSLMIYEKIGLWIPDLDRGLVRMYPEFRHGIEEISKLYSFSELADIPESLIQYKDQGLGSSTGIDGLFLISKESYPDLGQQGEWVAAVEAVTGLAQMNGYCGYLGKVAPKSETPLDLETSNQNLS